MQAMKNTSGWQSGFRTGVPVHQDLCSHVQKPDVMSDHVRIKVLQKNAKKVNKFSLLRCKFGVLCYCFYVVVAAALVYLTKEQKDEGTLVLHVIRLKSLIERRMVNVRSK